jgi:hypothetical protein
MKEWIMRKRNLLPAIVIAGLASQALAQGMRSPNDVGRIKIAAGIASIERNKKLIPATVGMGVWKSDSLVTGKNGRIGVTFNDNTRFAAGPNSRVEVTEFQFNNTTHKGQFLTRIDKGSVAIVSGQIAKSDRNAMRVRTPTALLGVRGTRFVVEVN